MTNKNYIKTVLIFSLFAVSLGGLLLHIRIHPLSVTYSNLVPLIAGIISVVIVPYLFYYKKTIDYGYVLNGMLVLLGTITMSHFAIVNISEPLTFGSLFLKTTLPDIFILWGKLILGKAIFDLEMFGYNPETERLGNTIRYPNFGWWIVHLIVISIVYASGNLLWR